MAAQSVNVSMDIDWTRLNGLAGPYRLGDRKDTRVDPNWAKRNVIYRWVKGSTGEVAVVGETDRSLTERVDNYASGKPGSSTGSTNQKVYQEQVRLSQNGDCLHLEFVDRVSGFDLTSKRERRFAEGLLIAVTKPYL
jgi:hypothetical protein